LLQIVSDDAQSPVQRVCFIHHAVELLVAIRAAPVGIEPGGKTTGFGPEVGDGVIHLCVEEPVVLAAIGNELCISSHDDLVSFGGFVHNHVTHDGSALVRHVRELAPTLGEQVTDEELHRLELHADAEEKKTSGSAFDELDLRREEGERWHALPLLGTRIVSRANQVFADGGK